MKKITLTILASVLLSIFAMAQTRRSYEPEMVYVNGGTFQMGNDEGLAKESPAHSVTLSSFSIGKYTITQAQWMAVMGTDNNPSNFQGANLPVENVLWSDVQEYLARLNHMTGKNYRLPTEAEWEFAVQGGTLSRGFRYSGSNDLNAVAWWGDPNGTTHPVGRKAPNELGIYDMHGNVWEWCEDWYGEYEATPQIDPRRLDSDGFAHVIRGGSHYDAAGAFGYTFRNWMPRSNSGTIGFRVVLPQK